MDKIKVIHDTIGKTLTVWLGDPAKEHICEETSEEVVLMKARKGRVIGFELLHYRPQGKSEGLAVETLGRSRLRLDVVSTPGIPGRSKRKQPMSAAARLWAEEARRRDRQWAPSARPATEVMRYT